MTLLQAIQLLTADGWQVSFATEGEEHVVFIYRDGVPAIEGVREARPVADRQHYFHNATEERVVSYLLALANEQP